MPPEAATTLITCHANADFDAFAAMLAARRLYAPCALLFPGTQEKGLQKLIEEMALPSYDFIDAAGLDWKKFSRLVLVDTRQRSRLKHVRPLLEKENMLIEVWDHHPPSPDDITSDRMCLSSVGAVTSLLVERLQQRQTLLTAQEATLLGLGIYGDTGSFTYSSTTADDFKAAAWLLTQGMDVNKINEMAAHELTSLHIHTLDTLLESAQTHMVGNVRVVIAEASLEHYLGDFAYLAHRLMEMEKFQVLFAIGVMGDHIQIVARSRNAMVNVGDVCAALGGGGHAYAASASVRGKTVADVRETILRQLYKKAPSDKTAREYMSSPVIGINETTSIHEADELMLHFGLKTVPVFSQGTRRCIGLLNAHTASRASAHGLGSAPVVEYMQHHVETLPPTATLNELITVVVDMQQRLVPIVEGDEVSGVVTRTDLMNIFTADSEQQAGAGRGGKERNIGKYMQEHLPEDVRNLLLLAGRLGRELGLPVYAVGGFVRDLLLNCPNHDIDLVVEGNGIALAKRLAEELGGRVSEHREFLTSVVIFRDGGETEKRIDVATARLEYYEHPAALPIVELSSIKMDLFRRDFSINALAVRLDSTPFGQLVDFFGGQRDIRDRIIRVLHTLSFVEDPTRCLRAVRFEQRYKFSIGAGTEKLIKNALGLKLMERLSGQRLFNEYQHICNEADPAACFLRLESLGILKAISPKLVLHPRKQELLRRLGEILAWHRLLYFDETARSWLVYFLGLTANLNYFETAEHLMLLGLPQNQKDDILGQRERMRQVRNKLKDWQWKHDAGQGSISSFCALLRGLALEYVLFLMAAADSPRLSRNLSRYITQWRSEKADICGADLLRLGITAGPIYKRILDAALDAKLDGSAPDAESQLRLAMRLVRQEGERI